MTAGYPHVAGQALISRPIDIEAGNPSTVLPLCCRDSSSSFYAWRNRWLDENYMA